MDSYTVQRGDTLYSIARAHGLDWEILWEANKDLLASPSLIKEGQTLRIPSR
jgi:nucleoid-associated protein YgaU